MDDDKRRYERFNNQDLAIAVGRTGLQSMIRSNPSAECTNFSRTGMQFDSPSKLKLGDKLLIDITVEDITLRDIKAEVITRQPSPDGQWCHGVRFCLEDVDNSKVFHQLLLIEDRLKRFKAYG